MGRVLWIALLVAALVACPALAEQPAASKRDRGLRLYKSLPKDPLLVLGVWLDEPAAELEKLTDLMGRFTLINGEEQPQNPLDGLEERILGTLPADLLEHVGPEIALSVDLPPIDDAVTASQLSQAKALATLLADVGLLAQVRDSERVDTALRLLFTRFGGKTSDADGLVRVDLPLAGATEPETLSMFYAVRRGRLALGFTPEWVAGRLDEPSKGQRLIDGKDFSEVFSQLDGRPTDLTYINLPKLQQYLVDSQVVQFVMQTNPEMRQFVERFLTPETMSVGLGSTSVVLPHGVRTTHFGPPWMSGAAMSGGMVTALAIPNLLAAADRGRMRRTLTDIETIAVACEGFSSDSQTYPGPTEGWVPVETIAAYLEPVYIAQLPVQDAWQNPILYWSNGGSYRIISTGKDGQMDRDWSGEIKPGGAGDKQGDIVYGDGRLLVLPGRGAN